MSVYRTIGPLVVENLAYNLNRVLHSRKKCTRTGTGRADFVQI